MVSVYLSLCYDQILQSSAQKLHKHSILVHITQYNYSISSHYMSEDNHKHNKLKELHDFLGCNFASFPTHRLP